MKTFAQVTLDMYYENREPDFTKDIFNDVMFSDLRRVYWFWIFDAAGKCIGDVSCPDSVLLGRWVDRHGGKIRWRD
jgi:hypothetical protein